MRDLLEGKSWYHVWTDAPDGMQATAQTSLEEFARMLPHGSGLDGSWHVDVRRRSQGFTLRTSWHAMNEDGFYVGWYPVRIVLGREKGTGALTLVSVRCRNADPMFGTADYLADVMSDVLREANGGKAVA